MKDRIAELTKALEAAVGRLQSIDGNINQLRGQIEQFQNQRPPLIEEIIGVKRAIEEMQKLLPKEKK